MPIPDSETVSGVSVAFVAIDSFADFLAANSGLNFTVIVQVAPAGSDDGQLLVCENHDA